jgi:transposase
MVWDADARQVVQEAVEGKINRFRASVRLNVSLRTVQRKMKEYRERGEECFEHGNKGKAPSNKVDIDAIIAFIEEHHPRIEGGHATDGMT